MKVQLGRHINRRHFLVLAGCSISCLRTFADAVKRRFAVSLGQAHKGTLEVDTRLLDSYGGPPANIRAFYLDARAVFEGSPAADFSDPAIVKAARTHGLDLMGGPMLGDLRDDGVTIWLRPVESTPLTVTVTESPGGETRSYLVDKLKPGIEQRIRLNALAPATAYRYAITAGKRKIAEGGFTTGPSSGAKGLFRVTFGSCCHKIGVHNPDLFRQILKRKPEAMLLLGDIAADDRNNKVNMHRSDYQLRDVSEPWRDLAAHVPLYASWDDHDYFNNDLSGVPDRFKPRDRDRVRAVWHQNWNNPPARDDREGIYFNARVGPVEIIMLDTRSCRDGGRRHKYGSYLGKRQMDWLKQTLKASTSPFKIISSGTMWSDFVSRAKDSWGSWDKEAREEIFNLIEQEKIGGVLLISGDRHGARGFRIPRASGITFYEHEVATLGGVPGPAGVVKNCPEQLFGYAGNGFVAFGEFTFDTSGREPRVTFRLIDESGTIREEHAYACRKGFLCEI